MIIYSDSTQGLNPERLNEFFVGWPKPPSPETFLIMLNQSYKIVLAIDDETNKVVGFINAISDGILSAYIPLLEVLPEYQNKGVGAKLVKMLLSVLSDFYMVDLICEKELQPYYEKLGMN